MKDFDDLAEDFPLSPYSRPHKKVPGQCEALTAVYDGGPVTRCEFSGRYKRDGHRVCIAHKRRWEPMGYVSKD